MSLDIADSTYLAQHRVTASQRQVAATERRIGNSQRRLLESARRLLIPVTGGSVDPGIQPSRAQRTQARILAGSLPPPNGSKVFAGNGVGGICDGCAERITKLDHEFEAVVSDALTLRFHRECFAAWFGQHP